MKFNTNLKKSMNKNKKNDKSKKGIKFNLQNKDKESSTIAEFSKTVNESYFTKTLDVNDYNKAKTSLSTKKKRKFKLNNEPENINDIKDIVKLVDNVHQNITKLFESNDIFSNNKSLMMSSLDLNNPNKTFMELDYRSSKNLLGNYDEEFSNSPEKKGTTLKKKNNMSNVDIFKSYSGDNNEQLKNSINEEQIKSNNDSLPIESISKNLFNNKIENKPQNKRYQEEESPLIFDNNKIKDNNEKEEIQLIKKIDIINIFKKDKRILKNILKYLYDKEILTFISCNNYLNKERISFLDNKKEELLQILNLQKDETMETKIKKIKGYYSEEEITNTPKDFIISEETKNKLKELNNEENIQIFKSDYDKNIKDINLLIKIYKIFFILISEEKIYSIINENIIWKKCSEYFINNGQGKVGDFILEKISTFTFDSRTFNNIEKAIKENKEEFIKELKNNQNIYISSLIEEALEYFGVIFELKKTQGNIFIKILKNNQTVVNYLNNLKVRYFLAKYEEEDDD